MDADVSHGLEHEHMKDLLHEKLSELYIMKNPSNLTPKYHKK